MCRVPRARKNSTITLYIDTNHFKYILRVKSYYYNSLILLILNSLISSRRMERIKLTSDQKSNQVETNIFHANKIEA